MPLSINIIFLLVGLSIEGTLTGVSSLSIWQAEVNCCFGLLIGSFFHCLKTWTQSKCGCNFLNLALGWSYMTKEVDSDVVYTVSGILIYMPYLHALHLVLLLHCGILNGLQLLVL